MKTNTANRWIKAAGIVLLLLPLVALSIDKNPPLDDPQLQARYEALNEQLRCLVCMNQSIADSNADLAADFRAQVRKLLLEGKTDSQIMHYMTTRYGDFVRYKPPLQPNTWLLWAGPFALLIVAAFILLLAVRKRSHLPSSEDSGENK